MRRESTQAQWRYKAGKPYAHIRRLTGSTQPESGTVTYGYDNVNLTSRTDARGIKSSYSYDVLNRLLSISYNGGNTYTRNFTYDAAGAGYSWGHLTSVSNSTATINYVSISPLGQVTASQEVTGGGAYNFSYYYNRAGTLTQENYPSGRVITTGYDGANRPNLVTGTLNSAQTNYVSNLTYYPHGAPNSYTYGNAVWPVFTYNNRLQMNQAWAAVNNNPNNFLFYFAFSYGTNNNNNGNIVGINELYGNSVPWGSMTSYSQSFSYDALNRLSSAADSGGWSRTFAYDQFGNAWVPSVSGIGYGVSTPAWNVYNGKNQVSSSTYDQAGNISVLPPGYSFLYDAESRVTSETGSGQNYFYDGLGQRVTKVVGGATTDYVYDAFGNLAEEYSPNSTWSKDYIFFDVQPVVIESASANPCSTCYLNYDYLGTVRMVTDASATVITRHDYLPFGDEITAGSAGRNSQFGSGADNVAQKFTGQYRDAETLNDAFPARYYTAPLMRFLTPDPAGLAAVDMTDPQTWNQYAYVRNNPLALVDPSGMGTTVPCQGQNNPPGCIPSPTNVSAYSGYINQQMWNSTNDLAYSSDVFQLISNQQENPVGNVLSAPENGVLLPVYGNTIFLGPSGANTVSGPPQASNPPARNSFQRQFLPADAKVCFGNGNPFYAPPDFDLSEIVAAGRAGGWNPFAANAAVGHYGTFDFQRSQGSAGSTTFYSGYTPASNLAVGAYLYGAGLDKDIASLIANTFAVFRSSNAGDPEQATYRNMGYDMAASGWVPQCGPK